MVDYATEEEQVEAIRRWWRENGRAVITGVVIGLAALGAWRGWDWYRTEQGLEASRLYEQVMQQVAGGERDKLVRHATTLRDDYAGTPYAALAALAAARAAVDADAPAEAEPWLRWTMNNADDVQLRHLARARLARIVAVGGDVERALELLDAEVPEAYTALYAEIRGDLLAERGDAAAAAEAYRRALDAEVSPVDPELLRRKLNRVEPGGADGGAGEDADEAAAG